MRDGSSPSQLNNKRLSIITNKAHTAITFIITNTNIDLNSILK